MLTIVERPKMDAPDLVAASCSCGYQSPPGLEPWVRRTWQQHAAAKGAPDGDE